MPSTVAFHFLLLGAGRVIRETGYVTPESLQRFISDDEVFSVRPPLSECALALQLLAQVGFLVEAEDLCVQYTRSNA